MRVNGTLYYTLKDHLGSASVVTDSTGAIVGEQRYYPFGETRLTTGSMFTDKLYTSQREVTGLGIYHYGARFYSPKLGRFLSADTIVPNAANPQDFNRYSYVRNNPLRYIDPTGHTSVCGFSYSDPECNSLPPRTPTKPTNTPTRTPISTPTRTPTATATPSSIQTAISYLEYSPLGQSLYDYGVAEGYTIEYSKTCAGHGGENIVVPPPSCYKATATFIAGTIAHEIAHNLLTGAGGTLFRRVSGNVNR